jgi:hypothetical protein
MGILAHGCVGEPTDPRLVSMRNPIVDVLDVMTSKLSTFPYGDDTMKRMIGLVQKAKGTPV